MTTAEKVQRGMATADDAEYVSELEEFARYVQRVASSYGPDVAWIADLQMEAFSAKATRVLNGGKCYE